MLLRIRNRFLDAVRSCRYLFGGFGTSLLSVLTLALLPFLVIVLSILLIGVLLIPGLIRGSRRLTRLERRRISRYLGVTVAEDYRPLTGPASTRLHIALTDEATRRDLLWLLFHATLGIFISMTGLALTVGTLFAVSVPLWWWLVPADRPVSMIYQITSWPGAFGMLGLATGYTLIAMLIAPPLARFHAGVGRRLLSPPPRRRLRLAEQVAQLTVSRAAALEAHGIELRRIEGALHDGTQNRIVAVSMHLGMVERALRRDPATALPLVLKAQDAATDALAGLREVVRSIYPPILADRGLAGALSALTSRSSIPCELRVERVPPIPAAVEAAAYYIVSESLTNVAKHSGAENVEVWVTSEKDNLLITVCDDGHGGADEALGTGLMGMRRRIAAFSGEMSLSSPPGGPTELNVVLPCES
ncbi:sensor histidine kinase [Amycolatopsis lurida]